MADNRGARVIDRPATSIRLLTWPGCSGQWLLAGRPRGELLLAALNGLVARASWGAQYTKQYSDLGRLDAGACFCFRPGLLLGLLSCGQI